MDMHRAPHHAWADHLLVEQASTGDQQAFATLVQRYQSQLQRFVRAWLDNEEADDVVQFVWMQLYRCLTTLQNHPPAGWSEASLKPWLLRVAWNRCLDERRWRKRHPRLCFSALEEASTEEGLAALLDPAPLPEEQAEQQDEQQRLWAAIQALAPRARAVVWLRYTEELTFNEIGHRLQISTITAKATFYRACAKLRVALSPLRESVPPPSRAGTRLCT